MEIGEKSFLEGLVMGNGPKDDNNIKERIGVLNPSRGRTILDELSPEEKRKTEKGYGANKEQRNGRKKTWEKDSRGGRPKKKIDGTRRNGSETSKGDTEQKETPEEAIESQEEAVEAPKEAIGLPKETVGKNEVLGLIKKLQELESERIKLRDAQSVFRNDPEKLSQKSEEYENNNGKIKETELLIGGKFLALREDLDNLKKEQGELSETIRKENLESENWKKAKEGLNRNIEDQKEVAELLGEIEKAAGVDAYIKMSMKRLENSEK